MNPANGWQEYILCPDCQKDVLHEAKREHNHEMRYGGDAIPKKEKKKQWKDTQRAEYAFKLTYFRGSIRDGRNRPNWATKMDPESDSE